MPSSRGSFQPGDQTPVSYVSWEAGSLPPAPPGKAPVLVHSTILIAFPAALQTPEVSSVVFLLGFAKSSSQH